MGRRSRPITKDAIFSYVYGVLYDPVYRARYSAHLKREFPRIPFYGDFWKWSDWGAALLSLHVGYEAAAPYPLKRIDAVDKKAKKAGVGPRPVLKSDRTKGEIVVDSETTLSGVPAEAWTFMLGNRNAVDWVLDQHKESVRRTGIAAPGFETFRFAEHKEKVIELLKRVTTVSIETMKIVDAMNTLPRLATTSENSDESAP
jgi:predicted helicase